MEGEQRLSASFQKQGVKQNCVARLDKSLKQETVTEGGAVEDRVTG